MQEFTIALISDGRPGHEKQSRGLVAALEKYLPCTVVAYRLHPLTWWQDILQLARFFLNISPTLRLSGHVDLIVGAGSHTHLAMLWGKRQTGARAVVCMTPSRLLRSSFDLCLVPFHDRVKPADNIFETIGPPSLVGGTVNQRQEKGLILIGGLDPGSHIWNADHIAACLKAIIERSPFLHWTIGGSPRTPPATEALIKKEIETIANVEYFSFQDTEPGWVEEQYRQCATVWVTGDSISMVYEALSFGARVGIIPVQWKKKDNKFQRSIDYLVKSNRVISCDNWLAGTVQWKKQGPLNEADRCAREIIRKWWPENLP